jgi:hypothetical protein
MPLAGGQTAEQLYTRTQMRAYDLEQQGYEVMQVWGCEWKAMLAGNRRLRQLAAQAKKRQLPGPLDLRRHSLFGGRTEPFKLRHQCTPEEEIIVLDIVCYTWIYILLSSPIGFAVSICDEVPAISAWPSPCADQRAAAKWPGMPSAAMDPRRA